MDTLLIATHTFYFIAMHTPPVIKKILSSTSESLAYPDGRKLLLYSVADDSYEELREYLKSLKLINVNAGMRGACAAFVLFASEWWTREYQGGVWQWEAIFLAAGLPSSTNASIRSQIVVEGLNFWGHRVEGQGKKFFRAVIRQGAVPLFYANHSKIKSLLSRTLRSAISLGLTQHEIEQHMLANAQTTEFNTKDEAFRHVLSQLAYDVFSMVEVADRIRKACMVNPRGDPSLLSSWRSKISTSHSSLRKSAGLLDELEAIIQETQSSRPPPLLHVERYLIQKDPCRPWGINSQVHARKKTSIDNVHRHFEMLDASGNVTFELPHYFSIESAPDAEVSSARIANGEIEYNGELTHISLDSRSLSLDGPAACSQHRAELRGPRGSPSSAKVNLFGGEAISLDDILFFTPIDGQLRFIGTSLGQFKNDVIHAVFNDGLWRVSPKDELSRVTEADCFVEIGEALLLHVLIRGAACVEGLGSNREISGSIFTGCGDLRLSRDASFRWQGAQLPFAPLNSYIGTPTLFIQDTEDGYSEVALHNLRARPAASDRPLAPLAECCGPLDVYWENDGVRRAKFRLTIFRAADGGGDCGKPSATSLFRPKWPKGAACSVTLNLKGVREAKSLNLDGTGISLLPSSLPDELFFDTSCHTSIPEFIELNLLWTDTSLSTKIRIPFPLSGARFYASNGAAIPSGGNLSRTSLFGSRLRLFSNNPARPSKHCITLKLLGTHNDPSSPTAGFTRLPQSISEHFEVDSTDFQNEIRLIDFLPVIDRLFSLSDALDSLVLLTVETENRTSAQIKISRYEAVLDSDYSGFFLPQETMEKMSPDEMALIGVCASSISALSLDTFPDGYAIQLTQIASEGAPCGRWLCNDALLTPGLAPWLISPSAESSLRFRPTIWRPATQTASITPTSPLASAVLDTDNTSRMGKLSQAVASFSDDLSSKSWWEIQRYLDSLEKSPLSALDIFRAVGRDPQASASLLFKMDPDHRSMGDLVSRMRSELGVLWEALPFSAWRTAGSSFLAELQAIPAIGTFYSEKLLSQQLDAISKSIPALSLQLEFIRYLLGIRDFQDIPENLLSYSKHTTHSGKKLNGDFSNMRQECLLRPFANQDWPPVVKDCNFLAEIELNFLEAAQKLPIESLSQLRTLILPLLFSQKDSKQPVCNTPVFLSFWASLSLDGSWLLLPHNKHRLAILREFAPAWFIKAYRAGCAACFASGLSTTHSS